MRKYIVPQSTTLTYLLSDHLGSTSLAVDAAGTLLTETRYKPWGEVRWTTENTTLPTRYTYTGQYSYIADDATDIGAAGFGLMFYNARWYDPSLGRFAQADTLIPTPSNPQAYDRYAYVYNNPLRYVDSSGHCVDGITTLVCLLAIGAVVLKVIDYGVTGYDMWQSGNVLDDPNSSQSDRLLAALNITLAVVFEAAEPDDFLPVGIPLDDVGRKLVLKQAREALAEGGLAGLANYIKKNLGEYADDTFKKLDELLGFDKVKFNDKPGQMGHIFNDDAGHLVDDTIENRNLLSNTVSSEFYVRTDEFGNNVFCRMLEDGTQVWVEVNKNGIIFNGGLNLVADSRCLP